MPKSLVDIIPPSKRRTMQDMGQIQSESAPPPPVSTYTPPSRGGMGGGRFPFITAVATLVIIALCIGALFAFSGAEVEVKPYTQTTRIDGEFTATGFVGDLPYEIISTEKIGTQSVPAESTAQANDPAQGTIVVYNESGSPQEFVKNTRFETPDGLIFKARDAVRIPTGTASNPGTIRVSVYAEAGGEAYNIGPSTFSVPGLSGGKLFDQVYGKSESPMAGGFTGERPSVSEATKETTLTALRSSLENEVMTAVKEEIPEGYVLLPGATFTSFDPEPDTSGAQGTVDVRLKATASAIVFPESALAKAVATKSLAIYGGEPVSFKSVEGLVLRATEAELPAGDEEFSFSLTGEATIVWDIDTAKIAGAVAGKKRESAEAILNGFTEVEAAYMTLKPFWRSTFPEDPAEVKIVITAP